MECNDSRRTQQLPTTWLVCFAAYPFVHSSDGSSLPVLPALTVVLLRGTAVLLAHVSALESSSPPNLRELASFWSQSANHLF
jgi:hypothetical protein